MTYLAERGAKLIDNYINSVTLGESQLQDLLQVVDLHRKRVPDF